MMSQAETEAKQPRGYDGAGKSGLTYTRGTYRYLSIEVVG